MMNERVSANRELMESESQTIAVRCTRNAWPKSAPGDGELRTMSTIVSPRTVSSWAELHGAYMSFLPDELRRLEAEGWDAQRIADLQTIVALRENIGFQLNLEGKNWPALRCGELRD